MLPPIEETTLQGNPNFATLHTILQNSILNPNGSTKKHPAQKDRDATSEALKTANIRAAKRHALRNALRSMELSAPPSSVSKAASKSLPTELLELIVLFSARLATANLPYNSVTVLESTVQWSSLESYLPTIGTLISSHLHNQAIALARIQNPATNPSYLHKSIPKLVENIKTAQDDISAKKIDLSNRRTALAGKSIALLNAYHTAINLVVQVLELTKHGSLSRYVKTKAEYLNASATQVELEMKEKCIKAEKMVYTPETAGALSNYMENLRDVQERLGERERGAKRELWGYGVGREDGGEKEKVMREIARVYGDLVTQCREVARDVARLKGT